MLIQFEYLATKDAFSRFALTGGSGLESLGVRPRLNPKVIP